MDTQDWKTIEHQLKAPFDPKIIRFRLLQEGPPRQREGNRLARVVAYVPAYAVADRLDNVVGAENWGFRSAPLGFVKGKVSAVKGCLSLFGRAPKEEFAEGIRVEPDESLVSEALRRCAGLWGVGRYLASLERWIEVTSPDPEAWTIPSAELEHLRAMLPRPIAGPEQKEPAEPLPLPVGGEETTAVTATALTERGEERTALEAVVAAEEAEAEEKKEPAEERGAEEGSAEAEEAAEDVERAEEMEAAEPESDADAFDESWSEPEEQEELEAWEDEPEEAASDEMVGEAALVTVERVHPEKVLAIRRLCLELEAQEPVGLEAMAPAVAEEVISRLMKAWGEKQRMASASKQPSLRSAPVSPDSAAAASTTEVSDELWGEYVRLHNEVYRHDPNPALRTTLKPKTIGFMIAGLERQLAERASRPQAAFARPGR